jgi:hypothetical protein
VQAFHVSTVQVQLDAAANVSTSPRGGSLARNHANAVLGGEGGEATLNGFYLVNDDSTLTITPPLTMPSTATVTVVQRDFDGKARGLQRRIIVRPEAED